MATSTTAAALRGELCLKSVTRSSVCLSVPTFLGRAASELLLPSRRRRHLTQLAVRAHAGRMCGGTSEESENEKIVGLIDLEDPLSVCLLPFCLGARTSLRI